jgi:hypothetical protein
MVGKFSGKSKAEGTEENLAQSRLRPVSPFSYVGQGRKGDREWTRMFAKIKTDEPQMDPPSREAMAGKLQIYADEALPGGAPPRLRGRSSRVAVTYL